MLAGFHVPAIPSFDVAGSAGAAAFWQYEFAMVGKVGDTVGRIVMFKDACVAQPADGVNVYVAVPRADVLMLAGLHVPAIPSFDTSGNTGGAEFWQSGPMALNVGVSVPTIEMFKEAGFAQLPAAGVNV
jgi:hypothetical protein